MLNFSKLIRRQLTKQLFASYTYAKYNYADPFNFQSMLTDEEKMIQDQARNYCQTKLKPRITKAFREHNSCPEVIKEMGELGLIGCTYKEYDLPGVSSVAFGIICKELDKIDSGFGTAFNVQSTLGLHPIMAFGTKEQKDKYIPDIVSGKIITCFGLTEPNAGSDIDQMETKAKPDGDHFIINGQKTWISNATVADIFVIWARDEKNALRGFILEKGMQGLTTQKIEGKLSLCASDTGFINMDNVRVHKSQMLNVKGLKGPLETLNMGRYCIVWSSLGSAEACFEQARQYALDRKQFGTPLASFQLIQKKLVDMSTEIALSQFSALQVGRLRDKNMAAPEMISMLKANNASKALNIARNARDILGGNGIVDEYGIFRHLVNLETVNTYEGTQDINSLIIGRAITGINSFTRKL